MVKIIFIIIILIAGYLYFSYARFYNLIGEINLPSPYIKKTINLENPKAKGSIKYVSLGDSLSAGIGSSDIKQTLVYQYGLHLSQQTRSVTIINLAQSGATSEDVINNQLTKAIQNRPDYITLFIGINDLHNRVSLSNFKNNLHLILEKLQKETEAQIVLINLPYLGEKDFVLPPYNFVLNIKTHQFNDVINSFNQTDRIRLVNLYGTPVIYSSDHFHPSGEGYLLWGKIINAD